MAGPELSALKKQSGYLTFTFSSFWPIGTKKIMWKPIAELDETSRHCKTVPKNILYPFWIAHALLNSALTFYNCVLYLSALYTLSYYKDQSMSRNVMILLTIETCDGFHWSSWERTDDINWKLSQLHCTPVLELTEINTLLFLRCLYQGTSAADGNCFPLVENGR